MLGEQCEHWKASEGSFGSTHSGDDIWKANLWDIQLRNWEGDS